MLKGLKRRALGLTKNLRIDRVLRDSVWRARRLPILCYHGISLLDEHEWKPPYYMRPSDFEGRLRILSDGGYSVLPLHEGLDRLASGTLPPRSVVVTFDDGNYNFLQHAYPLLATFGFPATVYLTTYYSEYNMPVFSGFCGYLLWKGRASVIDANNLIGGDERWDLRTAKGRALALRSLLGFADREALSAAQRHSLALALGGLLDVDYESVIEKRIVHILNSTEVADLATKGVDFQLHTHRHRTPMDRDLFLRELHDNRESIRRLTGSAPTHFCYPGGVHHPAFLPWLAEFGVTSAATCEAGLASPRTHPLLLPRLVDSISLSPLEFEAWLSGVGAFLPHRQFRAEARTA